MVSTDLVISGLHLFQQPTHSHYHHTSILGATGGIQESHASGQKTCTERPAFHPTTNSDRNLLHKNQLHQPNLVIASNPISSLLSNRLSTFLSRAPRFAWKYYPKKKGTAIRDSKKLRSAPQSIAKHQCLAITISSTRLKKPGYRLSACFLRVQRTSTCWTPWDSCISNVQPSSIRSPNQSKELNIQCSGTYHVQLDTLATQLLAGLVAKQSCKANCMI